MERDKILKLARKEIFEKMHKFNYINNIEVIDDVKEDSNLSSDLAMDPFDLLEVLMDIEEKIGIRIDDIMPIEIDDNLLDAIGFKSDKNRDVYRGHGMTMEVFGDEYYLGLRDMEDDLSELIQIRYLHNLQNISMDLYERDINTERLYDRSGE